MNTLATLADFLHSVPDAWITGIGGSAAVGIGWLVKHFTTRSTERATAMQTANTHESDNRVQLSVRAFDTLQGLVKDLQNEVSQQRDRTQKIESDYGQRIARLERRNSNMHRYIIKLLDTYLRIKAYVAALELIVVEVRPQWKRMEFPEMSLPAFDDDDSIPGS